MAKRAKAKIAHEEFVFWVSNPSLDYAMSLIELRHRPHPFEEDVTLKFHGDLHLSGSLQGSISDGDLARLSRLPGQDSEPAGRTSWRRGLDRCDHGAVRVLGRGSARCLLAIGSGHVGGFNPQHAGERAGVHAQAQLHQLDLIPRTGVRSGRLRRLTR